MGYKMGLGSRFDSFLAATNPRLLNTVTRPIRVKGCVIANITSTDVLHRFTLPAVGVKADAVPGRLNRMRISLLNPGLYLGQCSELCGANHRFIPTRFEVR